MIDASDPARTLRLGDGRRLTWCEYGAAGGQPVVYCHGWPSSRLEAAFLDVAAASAGLRLIAVDRPGFGGSDYQPTRRLLDWPQDVVALVNYLGVNRFAMIGVSGGAPYALACAAHLRDRVVAVTIVAGLGPLCGASAVAMSPSRRSLLDAARQRPRLLMAILFALRLWLRWLPGSFIGTFARGYPPCDRTLTTIASHRAQWRAMVLEAFRHGGRGPLHDAALLADEWGFDPAMIRCPTALWHGERDSIVPIAVGRLLAERIPGCHAHFLADDGHFSTVIGHAGSILTSLRAMCRPTRPEPATG